MATEETMLQSDSNAQATESKDWKVVVGEHFPGLVPSVAACVATACSLILSDLSNCPALVLVGQPSSSKTTILEFINPSCSYRSDNVTPRAFVTHAANIKKAELEKIDLLPRLKHKLWLVKDLAPIFSKRLDELTETVGVVTRILDGRGYQSDTGAQGQRGHTGDYRFGILAATTLLDPRIWKVMSRLGPRLLFLHVDAGQQSEEDQLEMIMGKISYSEKVEACRQAVTAHLEAVCNQHGGFGGMTWNNEAVDDLEMKRTIVQLANLGVKLRSQPARERQERDNEGVEFIPQLREGPARYLSLLYTLARGHAISDGRTMLAPADVAMVVRVALSSAPEELRLLLQAVLDSREPISTQQAARAIGCSLPTAANAVATLGAQGILVVEGDGVHSISLAPDYDWLRKFLDPV